MAAEHLAKGDGFFVDEDYEAAAEAYTQAAELDPNNARVFTARAHAHIKLEDYLAAVDDATRAIQLDPTAGLAYLRKGMAYFRLEEYESAKGAFEDGCRMAPGTAAFKTWIRKCDAELNDEAEMTEAQQPAPAPKAAAAAPPAATTTTTSRVADDLAPTTSSSAPHANGSAASEFATSPSGDQPMPDAKLPDILVAPPGMPQFEGKYRHQWYQLQKSVTVDIYAKNVPKDLVSCDFGDGSHLTFVIKDAAGEEEEFKLDVDLYGKVVPEGSKCEVLKSKIEITMPKAEQIQWGSLEKSNKVAAPNYSTPGSTAPRAYPSSYTKAPKDWDKVDNELTEMAKKGDLDDGDPLNNFFKKIFSQGDEDQQRAMKKSFLESNGTVLSTNWEDVGKKKVECTPPEGMELKKYG